MIFKLSGGVDHVTHHVWPVIMRPFCQTTLSTCSWPWCGLVV